MPLRRDTLLFITLVAALSATAIAFTTRDRPADPATGAADANAAHARARELFDDGHYSAAYGRLVRLADAGHVEAARLALLMATRGQELFGTDWSATPAQQLRWNALAGDHGPHFVPEPDAASGE